MVIHVDLLGQFRITINNISVGDWRRERSAGLVKLLALSTGHRLHREQAMESLWPEMSPDSSSANLRKAIHFARRTLGENELIALKNGVIELAPDRELVIDVETFEATAKAALRANRDASTRQSNC